MSDASQKRADDSKAITDKEAAKAATEEELQTSKDSKGSKLTEAMETAKYIGGLHEECDWLWTEPTGIPKTTRLSKTSRI